ncbi:formylglycine-generating enzyme family protein [Nostoc punctiforme FACHB-252]|uniref:Formylglycine-generating enzyme family protein n=2 Tax=Nostoc punctiforme TaxID=272131 RepID=A0ABR8HDJ7_NOSPU|nr:formylglycine-generating enzyme family protein [Nostoc punctiforme FACHB-252]
MEINHDCPECGTAINQIIVGIAGENQAQACVWIGGSTSNGWQTVSFSLNIPYTPGVYYIRTRYAQAYNSEDALGWWKVDRPDGPTEAANIGAIIVGVNHIFEYAGEYFCAVKWGGESGTWHEGTEHLLITPQGEVQFTSRFGLAAIQNLKIEGQTLSWSFDDNQTAASITFKVNSEDSYFWEEDQTGKLFQGWLHYPNEGRIDFRGRFFSSETSQFPQLRTFAFQVTTITIKDDDTEAFNLQPLEFDVALIEVNQSAQITTSSLIEIVNEAVLTKTEKYLNDVEQFLIQGVLANQTYEEIAASSGDSVEYLPVMKRTNLGKYLRNNVAPNLWKLLSTVFGKKVTKSNVKKVIEQFAASRHLTIHRHRQQSQYFIEDLGNGVLLEMVAIPKGSFIMGSPTGEPERSEDESPQHKVTIKPFFLGKYPVTQAQWQAVAAMQQVNRKLNPDPSNFKGENRPVESVSWYDAVEFCDRLSQYTGKPYRLPSEAQWEYACRAGTTTPFHFGQTITSELANYNGGVTYGAGSKGIYRGETTEVGSFAVANAFGLYDMHGEVWEWCADHWHGNYEGAPTDGSAWLEPSNDNDNRSRLLRSGSWLNFPGNCRCGYRHNSSPIIDRNDIGFRVLCAVAREL